MHTRITTITFGLLSPLAACSSSVSSDAKALEDGASMTAVVIAQRHYSGFNTAERLVVRDQTQWASVWATAHAGQTPEPPLPVVDFSRETVIVAALGMRNSGGYSIAVDSVVANGAGVKVFVAATSPGSNCATTAALTQPVTIVKISAVESSAQFHERSETHSCG